MANRQPCPSLTGIQRAGGLVQNEQGRVANKRAGNRDALPLPAAEQLVGDWRGKALWGVERENFGGGMSQNLAR